MNNDMAAGLKVLFVIDGLRRSGAERSLAEMLPLLAESGVEPIVACLSRSDEGVQSGVVASGHRVDFLDPGGLRSRIRSLRRLIAEERPALVHTTLFDSDMAGRLAARGTGVPVVSSIVNTSYDRVRFRDPSVRPWRLRAVRAVDGWTARRYTTHFHAITQAVKDAAVRDLRLRPGDVTVIERGRDPARLGTPSVERREQARRMLGVGREDRVLVNVGRQEFQKGQRYLLQAASRLMDSIPNMVVLIAGRAGHASSDLERLHGELALGERVRFLGHRDDVPEVLAAADLFVFPSLYEGLGGAVIEAMALGLPIVASDLPALREVVEAGENARLVTPGAARPLAATIAELLASPEVRASFGARSREIFEERFVLGRSAQRMASLYQAVARGGRTLAFQSGL